MIYISDSPVIPVSCFGLYKYRRAGIDDLVAVLDGEFGDWEVAVTFPRSLDLVQRWTGISLHDCESSSLDASNSLRLVHEDRIFLLRYGRRFIAGHCVDTDLMTKELLTSTTRTQSDSWMELDEWELSWIDFIGQQP